MKDLWLDDIAGMNRAQAEEAIRARVQTVYLGSHRVLTRVLGRQKLFLSTDDLGFACHVMLDGYWEMWLTQFFARIVKPGMTVVDVGANAGYYSILFGEAVGQTGRIVAIEPVPETADLLARSVALNGHAGKTRIAQVALGRDAAGEAHMLMPPGEPKNATVVAESVPGSIVVPATSLDMLLADLDRVDLIKIDAEGAEEEIVAGMQDTIIRHNPSVLLEFNARRSKDAAKFLSRLRESFGCLHLLDFDGQLKMVTDAQLLDVKSGEDQLLFLQSRRLP